MSAESVSLRVKCDKILVEGIENIALVVTATAGTVLASFIALGRKVFVLIHGHNFKISISPGCF
jgi:hypothetical protein